MTQLPMYSSNVDSPDTTLADGINDSIDIISVIDASVLSPAPNLMVIREDDEDEYPETIRYLTDAVGNVFHNVERGFQGLAKSFVVGAKVCRPLTAYDTDALKHNVEDHEDRILKAVISDPPAGYKKIINQYIDPSNGQVVNETED